MVKKDLVNAVIKQTGLTRAHAEVAVDTIFSATIKALQRHEPVEIRGFGTLYVKWLKSRVGYSPIAREHITVPERAVVKFRPATRLKEEVRDG